MSGSPFVVPVARLVRDVPSSLPVTFIAPFDAVETLPARGRAESDVPSGATVTVETVLESFDGGVVARGTVRAPWRGLCRRCSIDVSGELVVPVAERFAEGAEPEDEAYPLSGDELDLWPMVRDAVVLDLPIAPLCRLDCQGLCPHCGTDRNERRCDCAVERDPRWATLDALRTPEQAPLRPSDDR